MEQRKTISLIFFFCIGYLLLPLFFLPAETEYAICLFRIHDISPHQSHRKYEQIIRDILTVELENAGYRLNDQSAATRDKFSLISGPAVIELARGLGAQLAITGFYYVEEQRITLELKCYDIEQKKLITSGLRSGSLGLSVYNLVARMLQGMLTDMKALYYVREAGFQEPVKPETESEAAEIHYMESLTLLSDLEGMRIMLPGNVLLGEITTGTLTTNLPFPLSGKVQIELQKEGYHSKKSQIRIREAVQETYLSPINKKNRYALEFVSTAGQLLGLGVGFRYYINPDYFFVSAEDYFFVQHSLHADDKPVFHNDFKILAGFYLWGANAPFRIALSAGVGDVVTFFSVKGLMPKNDIYLNVGNIYFELNFSDWSLYLRQEFKYALGIGSNLLGRNWLGISGGAPIFSVGILGKW